jgi:transcriptional regulator with XRE-family HTH domain
VPQRVELHSALGQAVSEARAELGLSQDALALECGISRGWMGKIERGTANASLLILAKLPPVLGIGLADLFARAEQLVADSRE